MRGLYADENVPLPVVEELRRLGLDVLTMYEDGQFRFATKPGQIVCVGIAQSKVHCSFEHPLVPD